MRNKSKVSIFFFTFFIVNIFIISGIYAHVNLSDYQYKTTITLDCDEYKGYVVFEVPDEFYSVRDKYKKVQTYFDADEYYIENREETNFLEKNPNWYTIKAEEVDVDDVSYLTDSSLNTYVTLEGDEGFIEFNNPDFHVVDQIDVLLKDSLIDGVEVYDEYDKKLGFVLNRDGFKYSIDFHERVTSNKFKIKFIYSDVLKIVDVSFYKDNLIVEKNDIYFYVDNECDRIFNLYYGGYGDDYSSYYAYEYPMLDVKVSMDTMENSLYDNDFDSDKIKNDIDNCIYVENRDQRDINYNDIGDVCEDDDNDGVINAYDNCPDKYNSNQYDSDDDGVGDLCDNGDNRLLESNKTILYLVIGLVVLIFSFFAYKISIDLKD